MAARLDDVATEVSRLQRCMNDLVSIVALPSIWSGAEVRHIVQTLVDILLRMLRLEFAYASVDDPDGPPIEIVRAADSCELPFRPEEAAGRIREWLTGSRRHFRRCSSMPRTLQVSSG